MRKTIVFLLLTLSAGLSAFPVDDIVPDMSAPSGLNQFQLVFFVSHKMAQDLTAYPNNDFFALFEKGVNLNLGARFAILTGLEIQAAFQGWFSEQEKDLGVSYTLPAKQILKIKGEVQYFNYQNIGSSNPEQGFLLLLGLQNFPLIDRLSFNLNMGWDTYHDNPGFGIGFNLSLFDWLGLTGSYFPLLKLNQNDPGIGSYSAFTGGIKFVTWGHQFLLFVSNTYEINPRKMMLGAPNKSLFFGFTIQRTFSLGKQK